MPSDIAKEIVDKIFGDQKADAIDATNAAMNSATFDLIQQQKPVSYTHLTLPTILLV